MLNFLNFFSKSFFFQSLVCARELINPKYWQSKLHVEFYENLNTMRSERATNP